MAACHIHHVPLVQWQSARTDRDNDIVNLLFTAEFFRWTDLNFLAGEIEQAARKVDVARLNAIDHFFR